MIQLRTGKCIFFGLSLRKKRVKLKKNLSPYVGIFTNLMCQRSLGVCPYIKRFQLLRSQPVISSPFT